MVTLAWVSDSYFEKLIGNYKAYAFLIVNKSMLIDFVCFGFEFGLAKGN